MAIKIISAAALIYAMVMLAAFIEGYRKVKRDKRFSDYVIFPMGYLFFCFLTPIGFVVKIFKRITQ